MKRFLLFEILGAISLLLFSVGVGGYVANTFFQSERIALEGVAALPWTTAGLGFSALPMLYYARRVPRARVVILFLGAIQLALAAAASFAGWTIGVVLSLLVGAVYAFLSAAFTAGWIKARFP